MASSTMRLSGLISGMDTESIIKELVSAKQTKVDDAKKEQTKLEWKQDIWKELNTKIKNLQSKYVSTMRWSDAYSKKTTAVSNSSIVSVITGENAVNGVQNLEVNRLAKTAYLTGGKVALADPDETDDQGNTVQLTATTKVSKLSGLSTEFYGTDGSALTAVTKTLDITVGNDTKSLTIDSETTISDVLTKLKEAGLNANFDANQQRFFVSAKESGAAGSFTITGDDDVLNALGLNITKTITDESTTEVTDSITGERIPGASYIQGEDALITLNGAEFTSTNNVFEINGLTFTALSKTAAGESVTVTTQQDTDGIYDMIRNFLKEYNTVINELDKLYNADSASDYEPLTDDEKENMSDSEIEKYEQKIKDSLLRRDDSVNNIASALKTTMMKGVEVNGKNMYLSNFGIETLSYFTAADNEKNAYHIDGDENDSDTSGNADKLKSMIASDPDTVISFFSQLSQNLYTEMSNQSKSVEGYRSFGSFYDDKKMKTDYSDYTTKISELEDKLADYEDNWYEKFASMETALAKLQSSASAVTGLLGGSS